METHEKLPRVITERCSWIASDAIPDVQPETDPVSRHARVCTSWSRQTSERSRVPTLMDRSLEKFAAHLRSVRAGRLFLRWHRFLSVVVSQSHFLLLLDVSSLIWGTSNAESTNCNVASVGVITLENLRHARSDDWKLNCSFFSLFLFFLPGGKKCN